CPGDWGANGGNLELLHRRTRTVRAMSCLSETEGRLCVMVMPSCHSEPSIHYWAGKYPGKLGWLIGPRDWARKKVRAWLPYALDNDAFTSWTSGRPFDVEAWRKHLKSARRSGQRPLWVLVPDKVADRKGTLEYWDIYADEAAQFGWDLAFAVQDGMSPSDVPAR